MKTLQISFLRKILSYWSTLFIFSFCIIPISQSAEATFIWSPNSEPNLAGYKIYSGTASGDYNTSIDVGLPEINNEQVSAKITALTEGITYYFSATAYDSDGFESAFSQEVQWTALISEPLAAPENDFNGDGVADILLSNNASGSIWLFETNGNSEEIINSLDPSIFSTLTVIDTNDFNGDQKEDILFRSATTGQIWLFEMNGNTVINNTLIASVDLVWDIISTKDFNGDHIADILLRNADNGIIWLFELNGSTIINSNPVASVDLSWNIASTEDYNGDNITDILLRNADNGIIWLFELNGSIIINSNPVAGADLSWDIL